MLEQKLPRKYWIEINRLLVPFGKHVCTGPRVLTAGRGDGPSLT
jgi:endonuclease III